VLVEEPWAAILWRPGSQWRQGQEAEALQQPDQTPPLPANKRRCVVPAAARKGPPRPMRVLEISVAHLDHGHENRLSSETELCSSG